MNANLVKYGKYGAIALVVGLVAYTVVQKNKKAKVAKALAEAKVVAEAKAKALKAATEKRLTGGVKPSNVTFNPLSNAVADSEF